jgi:Icc-related predicted phosphoesterase
VGSESIRKIIDEFAPEFAVCGHIHECGGKGETLGKTSLLNVGMLGQGQFGEITSEGLEHRVF